MGLKISNGRGQGKIVFYTGSGTDNLERVRIDKFGNVGIGTTSPATKLHVDSGTAGDSGITTRITNSAQLGTDANGKIIDVGADPNAGVNVKKLVTNSGLPTSVTNPPSSDTSTTFSVLHGNIRFRLRHINNTDDGLLLQARLEKTPAPTASVSLNATSINYNASDGESPKTDLNTFTTANYSTYQTLTSINPNNRSGLVNLYSDSNDLTFDNQYFVINFTKGNGNADLSGPIKVMIISKY